MDNRIIQDMPEIYEKAKPYIDYLESLGFKTRHNMMYFSPGNEDNYEYFNGWMYPGSKEDDLVVDLVSFTGELKLEVYKFRIIKTPKNYYVREGDKNYPFIMTNARKDDAWESKIVDNLKDFKKEVGNYLKTLKTYKEKVKHYELEKDFT